MPWFALILAVVSEIKEISHNLVQTRFSLAGSRYPLKIIFTMVLFASFIILIYVFGVVCADLYFVKNIKTMMSICGVIGIACFGIYREIQGVYHLLMIADHLYSWMNSLLAFLMVTIYL